MKITKLFSVSVISVLLSMAFEASAGAYSSYAANYFQAGQYYRAVATFNALGNWGGNAYDVYANLASAYSNANAGYSYALYEYAYQDSSSACYYSSSYAEAAKNYAYNAQYYAYLVYAGYNYYSDAITNNYYADYYGSLAAQYNFYCG